MLRRHFQAWLGVSLATVSQVHAGEPEGEGQTLRGRLQPGPKPKLVTAEGEVALTGDPGTLLVLGDVRLAGFDLEVTGQPPEKEGGAFRVGPIHKRSIHVHKGDQRLMITYWCEVCSIRTFTPGVCMCCQDETAVDLKEKLPSDSLETR